MNVNSESIERLLDLYNYHVKMINKADDPVIKDFYRDMNLGITLSLSVLGIDIDLQEVY